MTKHVTVLLWLSSCVALLAGCHIVPLRSGRPDPGPRYWLQGTLSGTPLSGPAVVTITPGSPVAPVVSATSDTPFLVAASASDPVVGLQQLTLFAEITVCTTQGTGVVKPTATWGWATGNGAYPSTLNTQFAPNIATDMGTYDEVDYKLTTWSQSAGGKFAFSPPLQCRFVRPGLQPHPCIP